MLDVGGAYLFPQQMGEQELVVLEDDGYGGIIVNLRGFTGSRAEYNTRRLSPIFVEHVPTVELNRYLDKLYSDRADRAWNQSSYRPRR